jgi:hypothetical protein
LELVCIDIEDSTTSYHFQILTIVKKRPENALGEIIGEADQEQGSSL